jgi:hypothetical protein
MQLRGKKKDDLAIARHSTEYILQKSNCLQS